MNELPPGRYRHYKGNEYTVIGTACHSETHEELVVYRQESSCSSRSAGSRWSWSGSEKKSARSPEQLRPLVEVGHPDLSVRRQCALPGLCRARLYDEPAAETAANWRLRRRIDQGYTAHPFLGSRRLTQWLVEQGETGTRWRVQRLMRLMGLEAIDPKPQRSAAGRGHRIYPYWLRDVRIERPDQVGSTDIT